MGKLAEPFNSEAYCLDQNWHKLLECLAEQSDIIVLEFDQNGDRISHNCIQLNLVSSLPRRIDYNIIKQAHPNKFSENIALPNYKYLIARVNTTTDTFWRMWLAPKEPPALPIYENLAFGIIQLSEDWSFLHANNHLCTLLGVNRDELAEFGWRDTFDPVQLMKIEKHIDSHLYMFNSYVFDFTYTSPLGRKVVLQLNACANASPSTGACRYDLVLIDITEKYNYEQQLIESASQDGLTGLLNHRSFFERLRDLPEDVIRRGTLLFIDVDKFKHINDTYGHKVGDEVLKSIANCLKSDFSKDDLLARFGGDEFVVFTQSIDHTLFQVSHIDKLQFHFREAIQSLPGTLELTVSIGLVAGNSINKDEQNIDLIINTLVENADLAMYRAKRSNLKEHFCLYNDDLRLQAIKNTARNEEVLRLLDKAQMSVLFQPIYQLNKVISVEALIRLNDMVHHDNISELLDSARHHNQKEEIFRTIFEFEIEEYIRLCNSLPKGTLVPKLNINIEPSELDSAAELNKLTEIVTLHGVPPAQIYLEITETSIETQPQQWLQSLRVLNDQGFCLSIDDFGTGYSSLKRLSNSRFNQLKIDRYFLQDIDKQSEKTVFLKAILLLAKELGIETLAEGVESQAEFEFLSQYNIAYYQGYHFCRPKPKEYISKLIQAGGVTFEA